MCRIKSVSVFTNRPTIYNCYCCIARCCRHHTGMFESDLLLFVGFLLVLYLIYVLIVHDHIVTVPYDCVLLVPRLDNPDRRWRMFRGGWHFLPCYRLWMVLYPLLWRSAKYFAAQYQQLTDSMLTPVRDLKRDFADIPVIARVKTDGSRRYALYSCTIEYDVDIGVDRGFDHCHMDKVYLAADGSSGGIVRNDVQRNMEQLLRCIDVNQSLDGAKTITHLESMLCSDIVTWKCPICVTRVKVTAAAEKYADEFIDMLIDHHWRR